VVRGMCTSPEFFENFFLENGAFWHSLKDFTKMCSLCYERWVGTAF